MYYIICNKTIILPFIECRCICVYAYVYVCVWVQVYINIWCHTLLKIRRYTYINPQSRCVRKLHAQWMFKSMVDTVIWLPVLFLKDLFPQILEMLSSRKALGSQFSKKLSSNKEHYLVQSHSPSWSQFPCNEWGDAVA